METERKYVYAGFWKRFQASIVDLLITCPIWFFLTGWYDPFNADRSIQNTISLEFNTLLATVLWFGYELVMHVEYDGQTVGKRVAGIRLIMENKSNLTYGKVFLRTLTSYLSATVIALGYFWVAWDHKKQAWHDKIAQTLVVKA